MSEPRHTQAIVHPARYVGTAITTNGDVGVLFDVLTADGTPCRLVLAIPKGDCQQVRDGMTSAVAAIDNHN